MNKRLDRPLLSLANKRAREGGYGDAAHYMRLHESIHPAEVTLHVIKCMAAKRKDTNR